MKQALLLLALILPLFAAPARADRYSSDDYRSVEKMVDGLNERFTRVLQKRDRYGSSERIREKLYRIDIGIRTVKKALRDREVNPRRLHDDCYSLSDLLREVEDAYSSKGYERGYERPPSRHFYFGW